MSCHCIQGYSHVNVTLGFQGKIAHSKFMSLFVHSKSAVPTKVWKTVF